MQKHSKVELAKVKLVLNFPFFSVLLLKRPLVEDYSIPTACTDGEEIRYNPDFMESLPVDEVAGVLGHEVFHIANLHHLRRSGRELKRWNYACDYASNPILIDSGLKLPKGCLFDEQYRDMSAEKIYDMLDMEEEKKKTGDKPGIGDVMDAKGKNGEMPTPDEVKTMIAKVRSDLAAAAQTAKMAGKMPKGMDILIQQAMKVGQDWRQRLASFLNERTRSDYSFRRANPRYIGQGVYLPTLDTVDKGRFILAVDTSGSNIAQEQLQKTANEVMSILSLSADMLTVIYCDAAVAHVQEIDPNNPEPLQYKGGGGTSFKPVTDWIEKNQAEPEVLIYFTDLQVDSYPKEPSYPVLWVTDDLLMEAPYGETIYVN